MKIISDEFAFNPSRRAADLCRCCLVIVAVAIAAAVPARAFDSRISDELALRGGVKSDQMSPPEAPVGNDSPVYFDFDPESVKDKDVVVVSIQGVRYDGMGVLGFEIECVEWLINHFNPNGPNPPFVDVKALAARKDIKLNDDFAGDPDPLHFDESLRKQFKAAGLNYLVVPLGWTHDPRRSEQALDNFVKWLPQVCAAAEKYHKPVYVMSHSWGTMLAFSTLARLSAAGSPARVAKFVTMGSPLVPGTWWLQAFVGWESTFDGLSKKVVKPDNVGKWFNFWAQRDVVSNKIPVADSNSRIDERADGIASQLKKADEDPKSKKQADADLSLLNTAKYWHVSYLSGYNQNFVSIHAELQEDVFLSYIKEKLEGSAGAFDISMRQ